MDIYTYVATSNPYQAKSILHKYGYSVTGVNTTEDLGTCLRKLVAYEGETAFNDILASHPDKEVIIEKYLAENKPAEKQEFKNCNGDSGCGCKKHDAYMNFNGADAIAGRSTREVSVFIIASALLLATAIISKK
jgi:hypothetical protein